MAATYTLQENDIIAGSGKRQVKALIAYAAESYSSGLAVDKAQLGLPTEIEILNVMVGSPADANLYKYDASSQKIRIFTAATGVEVSGNQTVDITVVASGW